MFLIKTFHFWHFKRIKKCNFWHPVLASKTWGIFSLFFSVFWGSLGVYIKKLGIYFQQGRRYKFGADGGHFSEILTIGVHFLLLGNYMSVHSKIEPAATNIYRDIAKCLTCYGFFLIKNNYGEKTSININISQYNYL